MIRVLLFSLTVSAAVFFSWSSAAALTLADTSAGYSMTLPEGWERMPPDIALKKSEAFGNLLPVPEDSSVRMHIQGAILRQPDGVHTQELLVLSTQNKAFGLDADALRMLAKPGNAILVELEAGMRAALERSGMTVRTSLMLEDGLRLSYGPDAAARYDAGHDALYRVMEFRFSISHTIIAILSRAEGNATDASFLPDTLVIAPDKQLGREGLRKFKESMSSLFAIAAMLVMIMVMRRRRIQILGR